MEERSGASLSDEKLFDDIWSGGGEEGGIRANAPTVAKINYIGTDRTHLQSFLSPG
jgi:hypothetical protein